MAKTFLRALCGKSVLQKNKYACQIIDNGRKLYCKKHTTSNIVCQKSGEEEIGMTFREIRVVHWPNIIWT
jgi:hypothetical protein